MPSPMPQVLRWAHQRRRCPTPVPSLTAVPTTTDVMSSLKARSLCAGLAFPKEPHSRRCCRTCSGDWAHSRPAEEAKGLIFNHLQSSHEKRPDSFRCYSLLESFFLTRTLSEV
ncbi:hypothetical protein chiPu_0009204 [Chiloscyllium punctatum]|uniref:Uncharacterized protein n=1 Tax=Chiloscyllium punctatum TaxID=137246 RepID=A0A401SK32_CHIPU|nr:hypothetical protein [Chiloscyllium punctatum]